MDETSIDCVITWVNGNAPQHRQLRDAHMAEATGILHENAINPHRWIESDEILYCIRSIENHAPWVRKIWIVVDHDAPDLSSLPDAITAKVNIVYHREIFQGFEQALPTFNSLAIETMLWRIHGLSERFLYFNDDVFLTAPLSIRDVFVEDAPVLRGRWVDYSALEHDTKAQDDPAMFNHFMQINAARLVGYPAHNLFSTAHVVHPFRRSVMARLFDQHRAAFTQNMMYKFRDLCQFLPQALHNHACLADQNAVQLQHKDHLHIYSGQGNNRPPHETRVLLQAAASTSIKVLCINDLPQLEVLVPDARRILSDLVGD